MPDSNLSRVAAWLAEEERRKREAAAPPAEDGRPSYTIRPNPDHGPLVDLADTFGFDARGSVIDRQGILSASPRHVVDIVNVPGSEAGKRYRRELGEGGDQTIQGLRDSGYESVTSSEFDARQAAAAAAASRGSPPPGKLPFISGLPTHPAGKPASAYALPRPAGKPSMEEAMAGAANLSRPAATPSAPAPAAKATPRSTLEKARGRRSVEVRSTKEGVQPQLRVPEALPAPSSAAASLSPRVSSFLQGRRNPSGLDEAQRKDNLNQLSANLSQAGEFLGAGVGGVRPRPDAYSNLQEQAGQPVAQYRQRYDEQRQQEQDEAALAEAEREATRAAEQMGFQRERATAQDQLARDRLAQEERIAGQRLEGENADRALRRSELSYRKKEGEELKKEMAKARQTERQSREDELDLQRLGTATSKAPFGEFQTALEGIDRLIPGLPYGVVPDEEPLGLRDRGARALSAVGGEFFMTDEGKAYATAIANLRDLIARMRSGAVLNEGEERHYLSLLGDRIFSDKRSAAQGINAVRQGIAQKLRNAQGGYQNVLPRYEATGATSYRAPIFGDTAPPRPTGKTITRPDGSVWQELANGEAEMVQPPTRRQ